MKPSYFTDSRQKIARIQTGTDMNSFIHTLQGTVTKKDRPLTTYQLQSLNLKLYYKIPKQIQLEINPIKVKILLEKVFLRKILESFVIKGIH